MEFEELMSALESDIIALEGENFAAFKLYHSYIYNINKASKAATKAFRHMKYAEASKQCGIVMSNVEKFRRELKKIADGDVETTAEQVIGAAFYAANTICQNLIYAAAIIGVTLAGKAIGKKVQDKGYTTEVVKDDEHGEIIDITYHQGYTKAGKFIKKHSFEAGILTMLVAKLVKYSKSNKEIDLSTMRKDRTTKSMYVNMLDDIMITAYKTAEALKEKCELKLNKSKKAATEGYYDDQLNLDIPVFEMFEFTVSDFQNMGFNKEEAVYICAEAIEVFGEEVGIANEANALRTAFDKYKAAVKSNTRRMWDNHKIKTELHAGIDPSVVAKLHNGTQKPPGDTGTTYSPNGAASTAMSNGWELVKFDNHRKGMLKELMNVDPVNIKFFGKSYRVPVQIMNFSDRDIKYGQDMLKDFVSKSMNISSKYGKAILDKYNSDLVSDGKPLTKVSQLNVGHVFIVLDDHDNQSDGIIVQVEDNVNHYNGEGYVINIPFNNKFEWTGHINALDEYMIMEAYSSANEGLFSKIFKINPNRKPPGDIGTTYSPNGAKYKNVPKYVKIYDPFISSTREVEVNVYSDLNYDEVEIIGFINKFAKDSKALFTKAEKSFCKSVYNDIIDDYELAIGYDMKPIKSYRNIPSGMIGIDELTVSTHKGILDMEVMLDVKEWDSDDNEWVDSDVDIRMLFENGTKYLGVVDIHDYDEISYPAK